MVLSIYASNYSIGGTMGKLVVKALAIAAVLIFLVACHLINTKMGLPDDNPVEQAVEELIEEELDVKVDLTPNSPEMKDAIKEVSQ